MQILPLFFLVWTLLIGHEPEQGRLVGKGIHPAVTTDPSGTVHVVYGQGNVMYYTASRNGEQFTTPVRVDSLPGLHLGASRGPQIAATAKSVVITAIDKPGNVWAYTLNQPAGHWQPKVRITDVDDIAKEGFVALTAGQSNTYNAVWLDLRMNQRNKIAGARSIDGGRTWSANQVLYQSPDGTVCECCQLSAVSQGNRVAVMFRNFLNGSRDMYLLTSTDGGQSFGKAQKIGVGTWILKACPMDGGGLFMTKEGVVSTVWRRADTLFAARPGQPEMKVGAGKQGKIVATPNGDHIVYQQNGHVWLTKPNQSQPTDIGPGAYPKLALLATNRIVCLWEYEGTVRALVI